MSLRVIGHVDQQACNSRRHLLAADAARRRETFHGKRFYSGSRSLECRVELSEYFSARCSWFQFCFHYRDLLRGQASAFRVSKQPVAAPRNVPNMKSDWCQAARAGIHLLIRKIATPSLDILFSEFERVQDRPLDGRDIGQCAA